MKNQKTQQAEIIYGAHSILECIKAKKRKIISIYTTNPNQNHFKESSLRCQKTKALQFITQIANTSRKFAKVMITWVW